MSNFVPNPTQRNDVLKNTLPQYMGGIITHRPAVDWLTLTATGMRESQEMSRWMTGTGLSPTKEPAKVRQYEGSMGDGWFHGQVIGENQYMTRFSGSLADVFMFDRLRPSGYECTRIDVQLTLPVPYNGSELYQFGRTLVDDLYEMEQARGQMARGIDPIMPPDGEFTIYLGNRADSQRFARFYVKPQDYGEWLLRFEVEFKDKAGLAGRVYRMVGNAPESMVKIVAGELQSWPPAHPLIRPFREYLTAVPAEIMKRERVRATPNKTLRWITRQVLPAWKKVLGHHDTRDRAMMLLYHLMEYAEWLD